MSKKLHYDEITSNIFLFMIAGYETTSTALAYAIYVLATKDKIQEKLQKEIDKIFNEGKEFDFDYIDNIDYLDFFICEVLRMYPIAIQAISRECNQDTTICGYAVKKGLLIFVVVLSTELIGVTYRRCHSARHFFVTLRSRIMGS